MAAARCTAAVGPVRLRPEFDPLADGDGAVAKHLFGKSIYIGSAGVKPGEHDPFAIAVMEEIGLDIAKHKPHTFEELDDWEGLNFDLIVTLSPEAHHKALELTRTLAAEVEYWPTPDPSDADRQPRAEARRLPRRCAIS